MYVVGDRGLLQKLIKTTCGTLGSRRSLSLGEALACMPSLPEVPSLLLVEIVTGRGCLPLQNCRSQTNKPKVYRAGGNVDPRSLDLIYGFECSPGGFHCLWGPVRL